MLLKKGSLYLWRKPAGLASVYGPEQSFLDAVEYNDTNILNYEPELPQIVQETIQGQGYDVTDTQKLRDKLMNTYDRAGERGLLNRLDTATSGFLYFADDPSIAEDYHTKQQAGDISKQYIALVAGDCRREIRKPHAIVTPEGENLFAIDASLMHHVQMNDRMVVVLNETFKSKGRGKEQQATTVCKILDADGANSWLNITIKKGARHQIRAHLAAIGYPIVGDRIYGKTEGDLGLRSVGVDY